MKYDHKKPKQYERIYVTIDENSLDGFLVVFEDENGESILARTRTMVQAYNRATHFRKVLDSGELLKPDKSVYEDL